MDSGPPTVAFTPNTPTSTTVFKHVLSVVLRLNATSPIRLAVQDCFPSPSITSFLFFPDIALRRLGGLTIGQSSILLHFKQFVWYLIKNNGNQMPTNGEWMALSHIDLATFLCLPNTMVAAKKWHLPSVRGQPDAVSPPTDSTLNSFSFGNQIYTAQGVSTRKIPPIEYSTANSPSSHLELVAKKKATPADNPESKVLEVDDNNSASDRDSNVLLPITIMQIHEPAYVSKEIYTKGLESSNTCPNNKVAKVESHKQTDSAPSKHVVEPWKFRSVLPDQLYKSEPIQSDHAWLKHKNEGCKNSNSNNFIGLEPGELQPKAEELLELLTRVFKVELKDVGPISGNLGSGYSTENVHEEDPQVTDVSSDPCIKSDDDPDTVQGVNSVISISNALVKLAKEAVVPTYWQGEPQGSAFVVYAEAQKKSDEKPP